MKGLHGFTKCLQYVGDNLYRDIPILHLLLFLEVVENMGITQPRLAEQLNAPQGTVSRTIKALGTYLRDATPEEIAAGHPKKIKEGYGLLRVEPDLYNRRQYAVFPTANGMRFAKELSDILAGFDQ